MAMIASSEVHAPNKTLENGHNHRDISLLERRQVPQNGQPMTTDPDVTNHVFRVKSLPQLGTDE